MKGIKSIPAPKTVMGTGITFSAAQFEEQLRSLQSQERLKKIQHYFKTGHGEYGEGDEFIGVRMHRFLPWLKSLWNASGGN